MRKSFEEINMNYALDLCNRSECQRMKVAAVITSTDYRAVYGIGYNGGPSGIDDTCTNQIGNCTCLHAEMNAIINCIASRYFDKVLFTTHAPCLNCATAIINLGGVKQVVYKNEYRLEDGINLLVQSGILVMKFN